MQKYTYKTDDGEVYEITYSDETRGSVTFGDGGTVVYTRGNRKTKFTLAECQSYDETDVLGNEIVYTEDDTNIVMLLCAEHNIPRSTLYSWIKQYKKLKASRHTPNTIAYNEYHNLKRRTNKLEEHLEIIKAAGCGTKLR